MNSSNAKVLLLAEGFTVRPAVTALAEKKAAKLRRHEAPRVGNVRIHVRREKPRNGVPRFAVSATGETRGLDFVAHSSGATPETALNSAFATLERAVTAAAGVRKTKRHREAPLIPFSRG
jgi:ribosome-associated translation inhibitor RaiA